MSNCLLSNQGEKSQGYPHRLLLAINIWIKWRTSKIARLLDRNLPPPWWYFWPPKPSPRGLRRQQSSRRKDLPLVRSTVVVQSRAIYTAALPPTYSFLRVLGGACHCHCRHRSVSRSQRWWCFPSSITLNTRLFCQWISHKSFASAAMEIRKNAGTV